MLPASGKLEQARKARDPRFDGRFFIGVRTTGIYCRPVCPVKMPRKENVAFFSSAAGASEAGYRPCLRCRPESAPGMPAWCGPSATVTRALRLINDGALDQGSVAILSDGLGVTTRHLAELFAKHLGASPKTVARTRRLHFAKKLIDETSLTMAEIALSSGYGSVRSFNDHFAQTYSRPPSSLRKTRSASDGSVELKMLFRQPYDFQSLLEFYRIRAIPYVENVGVENARVGHAIEGNACKSYERSFVLDGKSGHLSVSQSGNQLVCAVQGGSSGSLMRIMGKVRLMFDVDAVPEEINSVLCEDRIMRRLVKRRPGLRLPGAFDEFEIAVRAIVGQQVSVKGATTVMGRIAMQYGIETEFGRVFPTPEMLAELDPASLPMPSKRARAIKLLAVAVANGELGFNMDEQAFYAQLIAIPGIGPWTAQYICLRALSNPDSFLHGDLVIRKVAEKILGVSSEKKLINRAEAWRPWRGYAGMHLWRASAD
ncbi:MAG: DNA-3-methyladenine glycosylase 2 family protein [Gammaproteobacteria bacterium]|nr:DNA-3-methyladenine glycosylase 2 family protein [Gammaproteobacteria bacterium]